MKKTTLRFMLVLLCTAGIAACGNDEAPLTGEGGKPSKISPVNDTDRSIQFHYRAGILSEVIEKKGSILRFNYENNELTAVDISPEDKTMADGHGWMNFGREGRRIVVAATYEPNFSSIRTELELDENDVPVRITDAGVYSSDGNGQFILTREGQYYAEFTYGTERGQLVKQVVYDRATSEKVAVFDYEYDGHTGAASKTGLPLWYLACSAYWHRDYRSAYNRFLLNYAGNLVRETVAGTEKDGVYDYTYRYNGENVPVAMKGDIIDITISY
ncbi:MAG: hypothetical protein LBJ23_04075 [Tannerella sp.]|jgi:hypothetical protein|nr:hypothetical protein [Tannerella sp.]